MQCSSYDDCQAEPAHPRDASDGEDNSQKAMIRIPEAIRTGNISVFSKQKVLDVLEEINKAGFYFTVDSVRAHNNKHGRGDWWS